MRTGLCAKRTPSPLTNFGYSKFAVGDSAHKAPGDHPNSGQSFPRRPTVTAEAADFAERYWEIGKYPNEPHWLAGIAEFKLLDVASLTGLRWKIRKMRSENSEVNLGELPAINCVVQDEVGSDPKNRHRGSGMRCPLRAITGLVNCKRARGRFRELNPPRGTNQGN
jgi:hypothetical protein